MTLKSLNKLKRIFWLLIGSSLAIGLLVLLLAHSFFRPQFQELNLLIKKYTEMNISQNSGLHKYILIGIKRATILLPSPTYFKLTRTKDDIGVGQYSAVDFYTKNSFSHQVSVNSTKEIIHQLNHAKPGTLIIVEPGEYRFTGKKIDIRSAGEALAPIVLKAAQPGSVVFNMATSEGFLLNKPFWRIENLVFKGISGKDEWVHHAIHLVGNANHIYISNNQFINFNAHIKSNGQGKEGKNRHYPSNVIIEHNNFLNEWKRNTKFPVIPIDVVGGQSWTITNNFIADFGKNGRKGFGVTYGAYLKGGGVNGVIENNVVACEWNLPHTSSKDIRIGLSLGGGGTGNQYCVDGKCDFEHRAGIIRNNTIVNCMNDVSIYLSKAQDSQIYNNDLINTLGIDVRFEQSNALVYGNRMDGRIKSRDGAKIDQFDNEQIDY
ncbi:chondroitinase-B domain-containing protein [Alteromonadaceae bacterium BrNp21-10]|nr:chondroitinase-B domain-containing protein [Alteromonadaceae bacterium BrNp21-10]